MAEFLETEAIDIDATTDNDDCEGRDIATVSDDEFIDDTEQPESGYSYFTNVTGTYDDVMRDVENIDDLESRVIILIVMKKIMKS